MRILLRSAWKQGLRVGMWVGAVLGPLWWVLSRRRGLGLRQTRWRGGPMADGSGVWDVAEVARGFPETAATMLLDRYLVGGPGEVGASRSVRVFRVYRGAPAHFHRNCDETLLVLQGRGTFWMGEAREEREFGPGTLLCFGRGVVHAMPRLLEEPVVFLAVDSPPRAPEDVVFVDAAEAAGRGFIAEV